MKHSTLFAGLLIMLAPVFAIAEGALAPDVRAETQRAEMPADLAAARKAFLEGDYAAAYPILQPAAEDGDPVAQNILGLAHEMGYGMPVDLARAAAWFEKAAAQDFTPAITNLALLLREGGDGIAPDAEKAVALFDRGIALGDGFSMQKRAEMHEAGEGGPADPAQAAALYLQAAEAGESDAYERLGALYMAGVGVERDQPRAVGYFRRAAEAGNAAARSQLGVAYELGTGVAADLDRARDLYAHAARQGFVPALYNLAGLYNNGDGVPKDMVIAYELYRDAALRGHGMAAIMLGWIMVEERDAFFHDPVEGLAWCRVGEQRNTNPDFPADCEALPAYYSDADLAAARERAAAIIGQ